MVTCEYCSHSQQFGNGNCISCGGPLPKPAPRLVSRTFNVTREMIDATSFNDPTPIFVPGQTRATATEVTEE